MFIVGVGNSLNAKYSRREEKTLRDLIIKVQSASCFGNSLDEILARSDENCTHFDVLKISKRCKRFVDETKIRNFEIAEFFSRLHRTHAHALNR